MASSPIDSPQHIKRKSALKNSKLSSSTNSVDTNSPLRDSRSANIMNDDAAERANRRKSAHFGDLASGNGASGNAPGKNDGKRAVSALGQQAQIVGLAQKKAKRLSAVVPPAVGQVVPGVEVNNEKFEEWMKLATDNKITATNTWNFALIDYFADLTLLRNDEDQSINFQKASCTLDGCVKVWTSRVDSVATETGKLLSGLAGGGAAADDDDEVNEDEEEEEGGAPRKARKAPRSEATLAKSFETLKVKKFDLEFTVDPLFKKTCADFDEGGAMGLLMNHLGVDGKGQVVFDAGDAVAEDEEEGVEMEEDEVVDISYLRGFFPDMSQTMSLEISDTLADFRFSSDPQSIPDFASLVGLKDTFDDNASQAPFDDFTPTGDAQDFFGGEDFDMGGGSGGGFDDSASAGGFDDAEPGYGGAGGVGMAAPGDAHGPFDPRRQGGELVMALVGGGGDEEGMFDYFDKGFGKSWAGAEHWKLRKVSRKDLTAVATAKAPKVVKTPFTIDFSSPATAATSSKVLFAPAMKTSLTLPALAKTKRSNKRNGADPSKRKEEFLLPDDMHFSSRQLLRLFLKPKLALRMRKSAAAKINENANGEIDENFWAQAAADRADMEQQDGEIGDDGAPIPFETQFFHDDGDDGFADDVGGFDVSGGAGPGEEDDLWQGTQGPELKRARPENVHFAKKAKRVDVKRLKDDIWTGLKALVPAPSPASVDSDEEMPPPKTPTEVAPVKTFDTIIQDLRTTYPQDKMSEISTSFCFICLLHLANEEGLSIETARYDGNEGEDVGFMGLVDDDEIEEEEEDIAKKWKGRKLDSGVKMDRVIGELQALKVKKDPTAGRAA